MLPHPLGNRLLAVSLYELGGQGVVYVPDPETLSLGVPGRFGFLDRLRVAISNHDELLYLGPRKV